MRKLLLMFAGLELTGTIILTSVSSIDKPTTVNSVNYNQLYVLGDSLSDNGAVVGAASEVLNPLIGHGLIMDDPFYQNHSFSNGKVAAEVLADKLALNLDAAWKFDFGGEAYNHIGNNYALGGAQASEMAASDPKGMIFNHFTINKQVDALLNQHKIQDDDLIFFEIGSNDFLFQILDTSSSTKQEELINNSVSNQKSALEKLIANGNKHILVMNTPNLGKIPDYLGGDKEQLADKLTSDYNALWLDMVTELQEKYPHYIKVFDLHNTFDELLTDFAQKGGNIKQGAVSYSLSDIGPILEGKITPEYNEGVTFETINDHFFFDFVHPTASVHAKVGDMLYQLTQEAW